MIVTDAVEVKEVLTANVCEPRAALRSKGGVIWKRGVGDAREERLVVARSLIAVRALIRLGLRRVPLRLLRSPARLDHRSKLATAHVELNGGVHGLRVHLAQVIRIGSNLQLGSDPSKQVVELEHWPEVKFPLFQKPGARGQPARVWQESQLFWPLLARVAQPQLYRELVTLGRPADQKYELLPADRVRVLQSLVPKYTS